MSTLSDLLDDAVRDEHVAAPDLGRRAWRQGRRDLVRERLGAGVAVAAVLAVLALLAPVAGVPVEAPLADRATAVTGYPERIGRQLWVRELPDRPGPVAALLWAGDRRADQGDHGWFAVAPDGHRWRLPGTAPDDQVPTLSRDGRLLGSLLSPTGPYVVHDLVTGERTAFPDVGGHGGLAGPHHDLPHQQHAQAPGWFSPDGRRLLLSAAARAVEEPRRVLLLDVRSGRVDAVEVPPSQVAGWAASDRLVLVTTARADGRDGPGPVRTLVTDLSGRVLREVTVPQAPPTSQWSGVVSPDGRQVALLSDGAFDSPAEVRIADLATGRTPELVTIDVRSTCTGAWPSAGGPVVLVDSEGGLRSVRVLGGADEVSLVTGSVGPLCVLWAADGLDGSASGPLARWPRDPALQVAVALLLGGLALRLLRRRLDLRGLSAAARRARR